MNEKHNYCPDCFKQIGLRAKRCASCAAKARWKDLEYRQKTIEAVSEGLRVKWQDPEYKQKMCAMSKATWENPEHRHKISSALKEAWARGDFRDRNMSETNKVTWQNPETRRKRIEGIKEAYQDPVVRQRQSKACKTAWENPETRKKASKATKAAWLRGDFDTPEVRQKMSESARAALERPEVRRRRSEALTVAFQNLTTLHKMSESAKANWAAGVYDGVFTPPFESTEVPLAAALDICGIEHMSQYRPDGYSRPFDEFVPPNILIEAQGNYWHGPQKPKAKKRDAEKAAWAKKNGFHLVVMWEHEIKEQSAEALVRDRVLPLLSA